MSINRREQIRVTDKDIICYKILVVKKWLFFKKYRAPFFRYFYKFNKLYYTSIGKTYSNVYDGFHSFFNYKDAKTYSLDLGGSIIVKAVIPKGSQFITGVTSDVRGAFDSIVSDRIKILEIVK